MLKIRHLYGNLFYLMYEWQKNKMRSPVPEFSAAGGLIFFIMVNVVSVNTLLMAIFHTTTPILQVKSTESVVAMIAIIFCNYYFLASKSKFQIHKSNFEALTASERVILRRFLAITAIVTAAFFFLSAIVFALRR